MKHRHINTDTWTREAIDSVLQRGDLENWRSLFQSAKNNRQIAGNLREMAKFYREDGTFALVEGMLEKMQQKS